MSDTTDSEQRVVNGQAWEDLCDGLKEAGQLVFSEKAPANAFDRAEGYRYLSRMLRAGLESFLEQSLAHYQFFIERPRYNIGFVL